jgi:4-hydroxy-tetrahydrodipicolinate reductase
MGALIVEEALQDPGHFELVGAVEGEGHPRLGQPVPGASKIRVGHRLEEPLKKGADLIVEFTTPEASARHAGEAARAKVPLLVGTTGLSDHQFGQLREAARQIPILWSPNLSVGIAIVRKTIPPLFDQLRRFGLVPRTRIKLSETHHLQKKDSPSGTALQLAEDIRKASGLPLADGEIEAIREGQVVGVHTLSLEFGSERITLRHEAADRRVFAQGALLIAGEFLRLCRSPGLYRMDDLLSARPGTPARSGTAPAP